MILKLWQKITKQTPKAVDAFILVVDDNPVDRTLLESRLVKNGYRVTTSATGKEGLDAVRRLNPDIIILDYMLPDIKGPEICAILKSDPQTGDIPVIFLTAHDTAETLIDSYDQGADHYLSKPVQTKELLKTVHSLLQEKASSVE